MVRFLFRCKPFDVSVVKALNPQHVEVNTVSTGGSQLDVVEWFETLHFWLSVTLSFVTVKIIRQGDLQYVSRHFNCLKINCCNSLFWCEFWVGEFRQKAAIILKRRRSLKAGRSHWASLPLCMSIAEKAKCRWKTFFREMRYKKRKKWNPSHSLQTDCDREVELQQRATRVRQIFNTEKVCVVSKWIFC